MSKFQIIETNINEIVAKNDENTNEFQGGGDKRIPKAGIHHELESTGSFRLYSWHGATHTTRAQSS